LEITRILISKYKIMPSVNFSKGINSNLPTARNFGKTTLTVLRIFGIRRNMSYGNTTKLTRKSFPLCLKECEFCFNFGTPKQAVKKTCGFLVWHLRVNLLQPLSFIYLNGLGRQSHFIVNPVVMKAVDIQAIITTQTAGNKLSFLAFSPQSI